MNYILEKKILVRFFREINIYCGDAKRLKFVLSQDNFLKNCTKTYSVQFESCQNLICSARSTNKKVRSKIFQLQFEKLNQAVKESWNVFLNVHYIAIWYWQTGVQHKFITKNMLTRLDFAKIFSKFYVIVLNKMLTSKIFP